MQEKASVTDIANWLHEDKSTVSRDIKEYAIPHLAKKYDVSYYLDHQRVGLEALQDQATRLLSKVHEPDGHKYELAYMRNREIYHAHYQSLIDASPESKIDLPVSALRFNEFNEELVKLPKLPLTGRQMPMTPAQLDVFDAIHPRKPSAVVISKSRQVGISEALIRTALFHGFHKYRGKLVVVIAGTNEKTGQSLMDRLSKLLPPIKNQVKSEKKGEIILNNGTKYLIGTTNAEWIRGLENLGMCILEESAFWNDVEQGPDQSKVLNAIMPLVRTNGADIVSCSTPNGINNFHYGLLQAAETTMWESLYIDFNRGAQGLYTEEEKQYILAKNPVNADQEFWLKEITGSDSYFGDRTPEDFAKIADGMEEANYDDQ